MRPVKFFFPEKMRKKGFVQIRTGKNFIADIKITSFRPMCAILCDIPLLACILCS